MSTKKIQVAPTQEKNVKPHLDIASKIFIITLLLMGVNRAGVFKFRRLISYLCFTYCIFSYCVTLFILKNVAAIYENVNDTIEIYTALAQYALCCIFDFFTNKRLTRYYTILNKFDTEIGWTPKNNYKLYTKVLVTALSLLLVATLYYTSNVLDVIIVTLPVEILSIQCVPIIEIFYMSYLLDLILPRIRLINYHLENSLSLGSKKNLQEYIHFGELNEKNEVSMKKIMDFYQTIIEAFQTLYNTTKWQVLVILSFSFIGTLTFSFQVSLVIINGTRSIVGALVNIGLLLVLLGSLCAPCISCDLVHKEALRLRELVAMKLYDNKLDKSSRTVARALLALTESRDLTFSLMNMFNLDLSLPFTFTALLLTYLIILLQFDKVLNK